LFFEKVAFLMFFHLEELLMVFFFGFIGFLVLKFLPLVLLFDFKDFLIRIPKFFFLLKTLLFYY